MFISNESVLDNEVQDEDVGSTLTTTSKQKMQVYERITQHIIELLEKNPDSWLKPWAGGIEGMPKNLTTKKEYRGMNLFFLSLISDIKGNPFFLTFKQAQQMGGMVKKGAKGFPVFYYDTLKRDKVTDSGEVKKESFFFCKGYTVFSALDIEGIEVPEIVQPAEQIDFKPIENCERIVENYLDKPQIFHDQVNRAYHSKDENAIHLPPKNMFLSVEEYYSTLFHELGHSTGVEWRLKREEYMDKHETGSRHSHCKEELIAEISASFLCGLTGIDKKTINNSASYIDGWISFFKKDPKVLMQCAQKAQKSVDYIIRKEV